MEKLYNVVQLKEKLLYAVGKYADYSRHWCDLSNVEADYDETLETYNRDVWTGKSGGAIRDKAVEMLRVTTELFEDLRDNSMEELYHTMKMIVTCNEQEQMEIWGIFLEEALFTREFFERWMEYWEDCDAELEKALKDFLKCFTAVLEEKRLFNGI